MTQRGNDWPIDPTQTSGTELATVLNRMVDALDSTNHTDNTGDRPDYAVKGTMWLDGDVSEQNLMLKMYTGAADALLFEINDQTGHVQHYWKQVDLLDDTKDYGDGATDYYGFIRQRGGITEFYSSDTDGSAGIRAMSTSSFGLNVDGKLNLGYSETTSVNALSVQPRVNSGVQFYVTDANGTSFSNILLQPPIGSLQSGKLSGGVYQSNDPAEAIHAWFYGGQSSVALADGSLGGAEVGFYAGNPTTSYWAGLGNDGGGQGSNRFSLQIHRQGSGGDFQKYTVGGNVVMKVTSAGNVHGTGPYVEISDGRTKTVEECDLDAQDVVMGLSVKKFRRDGSSRWEYGFVAQDVQQVMPSAVVSFDGDDLHEELMRQKKRFHQRVYGEDATKSVLSEIQMPDIRLGLERDQINAVLLQHVQDLTRRLEALENG